jgi:hypothetical protein
LGSSPQTSDGAGSITALQTALRRGLHDQGHPLVGHRRGSGKMVTAAFRLPDQRVSQAVVRAAPLLSGCGVDHGGPDQRVPKSNGATVFRNFEEMVTFGRSKPVQGARTTGHREETEVTGALESREQEQVAGSLG